ncbi:hypothetical protein ACFQ0M_18635 [Kitasatospora aburaviensis]
MAYQTYPAPGPQSGSAEQSRVRPRILPGFGLRGPGGRSTC